MECKNILYSESHIFKKERNILINNIHNYEIFDPSNANNSLDLSGTDIVFFAGCSTGGNPCDYCDGSDLPCACAKALIQYFIETGRKIDYKNISDEYMDKLLRGNYE